MSTSSNKPPITFWIFAIFAFVWNLAGIGAFVQQVTMTPEALEALPIDERALYIDLPIWMTIAFAFAVFGGAIGCLVLLWKKAFAFHIFIASLVGILVQMYYNLFISNSIEVYGPGGFIMPIMVLVIGVALILYSAKAEKEGWVN